MEPAEEKKSGALRSLIEQFLAEDDSPSADEKAVDHDRYATCTETASGSVDSITVHNAKLAGRICNALAMFSSVRDLKFVKIDLRSIPLDKVWAADSLNCLHLSSNGRDNNLVIPPEIKKLRNLRELLIENTNIQGGLEHIAELPALTDLTIRSTNVTCLPMTFAHMKGLRSLAVEKSLLSVFPEVVCEMTSLTTLRLAENQLSGAIPASIAALTGLNMLFLSVNKLTNGLQYLAQLQGLSHLEAASNDFSGSLPSELSELSNLVHIDLGGNAFSGGVPAWLGGLAKLSQLGLARNKFTDVEPGALGGDSIDKIDLSGNHLTVLPSLQPSARTGPFKASKLNLSANPIPSGLAPTEYLCDVDWSHIEMPKGSSIQGYSLGPNVCFYECKKDAPNTRTAVDYSTWSLYDRDNDCDSCMDELSTFPQLLLRYPEKGVYYHASPGTLLYNVFPALRVFLCKLCEAQNTCVLTVLVRLWCSVAAAAKEHPTERDNLLGYADEIAEITREILKSNTLLDTKTFIRIVLPKQYWVATDKDGDANVNELLWASMHVFEFGFPIWFCIEFKCKHVLASPAVTSIMDYLFYSSINIGEKEFVNERKFTAPSHYWLDIAHLNPINTTYKALMCPRYTPATFFLLEGLSKAATLLLVATVSIDVYGKLGHTLFANSAAEGLLLLMLVTQIIYEIGQLGAVKWSLERHFADVWNSLDCAALALIGMWALLSPHRAAFDVGRALLSLSAIPLSLQMLQYISILETIGLLVLMIKSMVLDVAVFVLVYVVSIFGFGVCFYGLFYGQAPFDSSGETMLYLFQSTLGNFDFGALSGSPFNGVGTAVLVAFLVLTSVLLVNLLIAQMSSTYSRIKEKSREEWSFIMATYAQEYILLRERTPLCMAPPPFNAVTTLLAPLHYWALPRYKISIAGTVADYILGIVVISVRYLHFFCSMPYELVYLNSWYDRAISVVAVCAIPPYLLFNLICAMVRIFYVAVHVVPAPKTVDESFTGVNEDRKDYNIWYFTKMQQAEFIANNPLPEDGEEAEKGDDRKHELTNEAGMEMKTLTSAVESEETVNVLQLGIGAQKNPEPADPKEKKTVVAEVDMPTDAKPSGAAKEEASQERVVLFTQDDIHRIFHLGFSHSRRQSDEDQGQSARASADKIAALEDTIDSMRAEMGDMMRAFQVTQAAAQAEVRAAQAEMLSMIRVMAGK